MKRKPSRYIWFRFPKYDWDVPVYERKAYKKARFRRKSERLAPGYWETFVRRNNHGKGPGEGDV